VGLAQRRASGRAFDKAFDQLALFPELGRLRPEFGTDSRSYRVRQHVVIYRVIGVELEIARVVHGRRDIETVLSESEQ
jgi:plasmid stabilization system protein ParE